MPVCTWVCALSFGRCRMSKFWLLVYLDFFFETLRSSLVEPYALQLPFVLEYRAIGPTGMNVVVAKQGGWVWR